MKTSSETLKIMLLILNLKKWAAVRTNRITACFQYLPAPLLFLFLGPANTLLLSQTAPPNLITLAASTFETNSDGWLGTNNLHGSESLTTNPSYISVSEGTGDGALMYFAAPSKYIGDKRAAYNGVLRFKLKQSATSDLTSGNRFVLLGSTNLVLSFDLVIVPGTTWQVYDIPLNENVGWHKASSDGLTPSDVRATREDLIAALRSLKRLWIRAEYSGNPFDQTDLAEVMLLGQPSGPAQPVLSLSNYFGITVDGQVGRSYSIEYRSAFSSEATWQKLTDVVLSASPYLFIDQTSAGNSQRFYRAVLNP
jgi:hypothetical protein